MSIFYGESINFGSIDAKENSMETKKPNISMENPIKGENILKNVNSEKTIDLIEN